MEILDNNPPTEGIAERELTNDISTTYRSVVAIYTHGPQIEGLETPEFAGAIEDRATKWIEIPDPNNPEQTLSLPFLTPMAHASWLNPHFFSDKGYDPSNLLYCMLPQDLVSKLSPTELDSEFSMLRDKNGPLSIIIDYPEMSTPFYKNLQVDHWVDTLGTREGSPAATYHYRTFLKAKEDKIDEYVPDPSVRMITPEDMKDHAERIWGIYSRQFQPLVYDHPIVGALPKEVLIETLKSLDTKIAAFFDHDGVLQAFGYVVVHNLKLCPWLNEKYFRNEAQGLPIYYMPGVATAPESHVAASAKVMNYLIHDCLKEEKEVLLTFECSNRSARYIPKIVKRLFDQANFFEADELIEQKHRYEVVNLN